MWCNRAAVAEVAATSRSGTFVQNLNLSTIVKIYYSQLRLSHIQLTHTSPKILWNPNVSHNSTASFFDIFKRKKNGRFFIQYWFLCTSKCTTKNCAARIHWNVNRFLLLFICCWKSPYVVLPLSFLLKFDYSIEYFMHKQIWIHYYLSQ